MPCPLSCALAYTSAHPLDYPLLFKHNVPIVHGPHGPPGVDRHDFQRAMQSEGRWPWFVSEPRADTQGLYGMYPWDAERYLRGRSSLD